MTISSLRCDLHIHSNFSDSDASIEDIFKSAKDASICCIALTDHDTIDGLAQAKAVSAATGIEVIEGIEFSADHNGTEVHVLGYFIDSRNSRLVKDLKVIRELRRERLILMADKLNSMGINVDNDELMGMVSNGVPTRLHLGQYLTLKGVVSHIVEAFKKYLSPGRPAYVNRFKHSVKDAIDLIHECGGLAFLAHPHILPDSSMPEKFLGMGLDGLEVVYPRLVEPKSLIYNEMVERWAALKSGGSDAHGSYKKYTNVGAVSIPYAWVELMKQRLKDRVR